MQKQLLKKLLSGFLVILWSFSIGIIPAEAQKAQKLKIELGKTFQSDEVKIYLDKKLVYNKKLATPDSVLITDAFTVNKPKKPFRVTVEINGDRFEQSRPKHQQHQAAQNDGAGCDSEAHE